MRVVENSEIRLRLRVDEIRLRLRVGLYSDNSTRQLNANAKLMFQLKNWIMLPSERDKAWRV